MTRKEARAWMERWKIVNEFTDAEARAKTPEERFRDLEMLFASASLFPRPIDEEQETQRVRDLWMRLHAHYHP
jgi:hypothetical protein